MQITIVQISAHFLLLRLQTCMQHWQKNFVIMTIFFILFEQKVGKG